MKLLSFTDCAKVMQISERKFREDFVNEGKVPVFFISPRKRFIEESDLIKLLESRKKVKCQSISEEKPGGSSSTSTARQLDALLGRSQKEKLKKSSVN